MQCIDVISFETMAIAISNDEEIISNINHCVWERTPPNALVFVIYAFIVPVLASFGLCANFINAIVFMRPKMTPSAFTYLATLSWMDCLSCLLITLTALSRSLFFTSTFWLAYDFQWQTPLFGITTGAANLILACVSLDRLIYLWYGLPNGTPRFCRRRVARRMVFVVIFISSLVNMPYFFVFVVNKDGSFQTTEFYHSHYYKIHNWLTFVLLAVLPAIFLLVGNAAIIVAFRRWTKQSQVCQKTCNQSSNNKNSKNAQKRYQHQMKLTITIIIVIMLYLIGELPAHLTSRKSALNLVYGGDISKVNFQFMERLEIICITLNALQLSMNIIVYAVINPSFMPEFFMCLRGASDVCFRVFFITTMVRCCQRKCGSSGNGDGNRRGENISSSCGEVELGIDDVSTCARRLPRGREQKRVLNSWGDIEEGSRGGGCYGGGGRGRGHVRGEVELRHHGSPISSRCNSNINTSADNWSNQLRPAEWVWKRSSSLCDFSYDNNALSKDSLDDGVVNMREVEAAKKRHSMAL